MTTHFKVYCGVCNMPYVTSPDDIDRIVKCPDGHATVVKGLSEYDMAIFNAQVQADIAEELAKIEETK